MSYIALVDCNNFFVSCERLFTPKLLGRPVVVLSNNDGCIIARSNEAKALGIPMGAPFFKWKELLSAHNVAVLSSNFALYGDMSQRVMTALMHFGYELEIYSVDEAFMLIDDDSIGKEIRELVFKWTGIPVSVGIAKTKTLAKVAAHFAKKSEEGVFAPTEDELNTLLDSYPVEEIWGIGSRLKKRLAKKGILYTKQLMEREDPFIRKELTVTGLKTVYELRGRRCFSLETVPPPKQSIMTSRSFGRPIVEKAELIEAALSYATKGAEKLRAEGALANWMQLFITSSPHKQESYYYNHAFVHFLEPTNYTPHLLKEVRYAMEQIFKAGYAYKKAGVLLGGLVAESTVQQNLFLPHKKKRAEKERAVLSLIDKANSRYGYPIIHFASTPVDPSWKMQRKLSSPHYTTNWNDLLKIQL